jgi:hypothetical protein
VSALLELAERCEQATGPDRYLDASIQALAVLAEHPEPDDEALCLQVVRGPFADEIPSFTASLDAAMALVPDGWGSKAQQLGHPTFWTLVAPGTGHETIGCGSNFALALCAAALRARAAIAMEARQGGDGETRLHPKDDSAGRQASPNLSPGRP